MNTFDEIREQLLTRLEIDDILEVLGIDAEELVDRFEDRLMEKQDEVGEYLANMG